MSQAILKLANGNKLNTNTKDNPTLINWGSDQYNYSDLESSVKTGDFDKYLADQGIEGKDAEDMRKQLHAYLGGLESGKVKRNIDGSYDIYDPSLVTDNNPVKRNIFGKIKGDTKRLTLGFLNKAFMGLIPYKKPEENIESKSTQPQPLTKFQYNFGNALKRNIFKDDDMSESEISIWKNNPDKWTALSQSLNKYRNSLNGDYDFSDTSFSDKQAYLQELNNLETAINNKDTKALQQAFYNIGEADLYKLFEESKVTGSTPATNVNSKSSSDSGAGTKSDLIPAPSPSKDVTSNKDNVVKIPKEVKVFFNRDSEEIEGKKAPSSKLDDLYWWSFAMPKMLANKAKNASDSFINYFTTKHKEGGIIKAQYGMLTAPMIKVKQPSIDDLKAPMARFGSASAYNLDKTKSKPKVGINIGPETIGDARFLLTQYFNNKQQYNPATVMTDAPRVSAKVQSNLPAENYYANAANNVRNLGSRLVSADQTRNTATALEAEGQAIDLESKGKLANWEAITKSTQAAHEAENQNTIARVANANQNRARIAASQEAKSAFERAKELKSGQNVSTWLFGKQQKLTNQNAANRELEGQILQSSLQTTYDEAIEPFKQERDLAYSKYIQSDAAKSGIPFEQTAEYQNIIERLKTAQKDVNTRNQQSIWDFRKKHTGLNYLKKGGYFEKKALQDAREYNKTILNNNRELNKLLRLSITEGNKTIRGLSNYSADLIKNSLKI